MTHEVIPLSEIVKRASSAEGFINQCESEYESRLSDIASGIAKRASQHPFILISGPSGSGKTTSAHKLKSRLDQMGFETHILSLDDYFHPISNEERPLFEAHELDLESPVRVDSELLNSQLEALTQGKSVELPRFDFVSSTRQKSGKTLKIKKGELIILEGIHSLNPDVISRAEDFSTGIYVSVRTRIEHGDNSLLHPSKIRLARRMIRDGSARNRTASDTVALFESVERGENIYIMPHKHRADFDIDTFFPYELCVYKPVLPSSLPSDEEKHPWLTELFEVLAQLPSISQELVPKTSLLREFIS